MIVTTTRHGRTTRDTRYLLSHLSKEGGQRSRVVYVAAPVATAPEALAYMEALRDGSRARVAYHHLSLSPSAPLSPEQRDEAVARILNALGAEDHAHVVWQHSGKDRRGLAVDEHYHLVVGHVGPDSKALDDGRSFIRLEAAARSLEVDFGHDLTVSRRTAAVAAELDLQGRPDVAARLRGETLPEPPQSAMSSRQRARAERQGVSLPDVRDAVRKAWEQSDTPAALRAALGEHGLSVAAGDKRGVWLVTTGDGQTLGALDRLSGERRRVVAVRMQEPTYDTDPAACHAGPEKDLSGGPTGPRDCRAVGPAAGATGPSGARRGQSVAGSHGASTGYLAVTGKDAPGYRGACLPHRRADKALAVAVLTRAARSPEVRARVRRLRKPIRPRARDVLDARRLAKVDLDEILQRALALGRSAEAMVLRLQPPNDERSALLHRLRAASGRPVAVSPEAEAMDNEPPVYRPRF